MVNFELILTKKAARQLDRIKRGNRRIFLEITTALIKLQLDPYGGGSIAMRGTQSDRRLRIGQYRVIYTVNHGELLITVFQIGPRGDVYK